MNFGLSDDSACENKSCGDGKLLHLDPTFIAAIKPSPLFISNPPGVALLSTAAPLPVGKSPYYTVALLIPSLPAAKVIPMDTFGITTRVEERPGTLHYGGTCRPFLSSQHLWAGHETLPHPINTITSFFNNKEWLQGERLSLSL